MHALHHPLRAGFFPHRVSAVLSKVVKERPDSKGNSVPCETWENAQIQCEIYEGDYSPRTAIDSMSPSP